MSAPPRTLNTPADVLLHGQPDRRIPTHMVCAGCGRFVLVRKGGKCPPCVNTR